MEAAVSVIVGGEGVKRLTGDTRADVERTPQLHWTRDTADSTDGQQWEFWTPWAP